MDRKVASAELTRMFQEHAAVVPETTLGEAYQAFQTALDRGMEDHDHRLPVLLEETRELIHAHGEDCLVFDFLPCDNPTASSPGSHG
ncbi:hypothetical protein [Lignipirellula cremea]|uniref:Uncharacterized protein n=1 Tax=Lignipirellula cremea TaxID=2528010 RepID=A0A518DSL2_9BACT|nr:hypothetical protein [Lignipirellula cremea]QDU94832.1 hypothetical protein Pla8534_26400 [Lignipirellula cremea]